MYMGEVSLDVHQGLPFPDQPAASTIAQSPSVAAPWPSPVGVAHVLSQSSDLVAGHTTS